MKGCDAMDVPKGEWKLDLLKRLISKEGLRAISATPVPLVQKSDVMVWYFNPKGNYTVKPDYQIAFDLQKKPKKGEARAILNRAIL